MVAGELEQLISVAIESESCYTQMRSFTWTHTGLLGNVFI